MASNFCSTVTSSTSTLVVNNTPPAIGTITPTGTTTICSGDTLSFTVNESSGSLPLNYQWLFNGSPAGGINNNATYKATQNGIYSCVVSNCISAGVTSNDATLTVNNPPAKGTISPSGTTSICSGNSQTFTVNESGGTTPFNYQWLLNGNPATGTNTNVIYSATEPGLLTCVVSNMCSPGIISDTSVLVVNAPPALGSVSPTGTTTLCNGSTELFTVNEGSGSSPLSYLWLYNGSPAGGINTDVTYSATLDGDYTCVVSNMCSSGVTSDFSTLVVNSVAPAIGTITPSGTTIICSGTPPQIFTVTEGSGSLPFSYQWFLNGFPAGGANTNNTYYATQNGVYLCVVSNCLSAGVTSLSATLIINDPPDVVNITPSGNTSICSGNSQTFTVTEGSGTLPFSYQWYKNGSPAGGTNTNSKFSTTVSGTYTCVVFNTCSSGITSNAATLSVNIPPAVGTITPTGTISVCSGNSQIYTVNESSGSGPFSYQWLINGSPAGGTSTNHKYTADASGVYSCVVSNSCSSGVTSNTATFVVIYPPSAGSITPTGTFTFCSGNSQSFTATATGGTAPYIYHWLADGSTASGITSNSTYSAIVSGLYTCKVSNLCSFGIISDTATVIVNTLPAIGTITPGTTAICGGESQTFTVNESSGTLPFSYKWLFNGSPANGTNTDNTYSAVALFSGNYSCVVSNTCSFGFGVTSTFCYS